MADAELEAMNANVDGEEVDQFDDDDLSSTESTDATEPEAEEAKEAEEAEDEAIEPVAVKDEAKEGEAKEGEPAQSKQSYMLPKSRYDYQVAQRKKEAERADQLEEQNEALQSRIDALAQEARQEQERAPATDAVADLEKQIMAIDKEVEELRRDGDAEGAAQKQNQARRLERQIIRLEATTPESVDVDDIRKTAITQIRAEQALDSVITAVEQKYPQLREGDDEYNSDLVEEVMDLYDSFLAKGYAPAVSMQRAVGYTVGVSAPQKSNGGDRKKEAVKRNIKAAKKQPPDLDEVGHDSDRGGATKTLDISQMSIEDFERLGDVEEEKMLR
jgi:hypothetical protein